MKDLQIEAAGAWLRRVMSSRRVMFVMHLAVPAVLLLTSACATTAPRSPTAAPASTGAATVATPARASSSSSVNTATPPEASTLETRLRTEVHRWVGVPHVYGGTDEEGVDCSAFVQNVYHDVLGVALPRTTAEQAKQGTAIPAANLHAGDLVFFRTSRKARHVGIYLSEGEFAHASSSQGVTISQLRDRYWEDAYWTSRRILDPEHPGAVPALTKETAAAILTKDQEGPADRPDATTEPRRIGW